MCKYAKTHVYAEALEEQIKGHIIGEKMVMLRLLTIFMRVWINEDERLRKKGKPKDLKVKWNKLGNKCKIWNRKTDETNTKGTNEERNSGARQNAHFLRLRQQWSWNGQMAFADPLLFDRPFALLAAN